MQVRSGRETLQTPERLDTRFGVVAGLYVAALLSPAVLFVVVRWLHLGSEPLVLGLLGAVGTVLTGVVAWRVTRYGNLVAWFDSTWLALLVPAVGILPVFAYLFQAFLYVAFALSELRTESAASLVGFAGFFLGIAASCLGSALVHMARARLVDEAVGDGDVEIEWTAGWPHRDRFKFGLGVLVVGSPLFALLVWQLGLWATSAVLALGPILVLCIYSVVSERTYRVTPAGLEQRREARFLDSRRLISWSQCEGFSVTDRAIVLHRRLPHLDVRCSRWDLSLDTNEADVIAALEAHIGRRDA